MLKREISRTNILIASAGGMIGSGWLFSPYMSAQMAGSNALICWVLAALFMLIIALPLCEMGAMFPISGGMTTYLNFTHGLDVGFLFAWISWLAYVVMTPIEIQAILQYLSHFFPTLVSSTYNGNVVLTNIGYVIAISIMLFVVILNTLGIKLLTQCNKYASIIKFIVPMLATVALISTTNSYQNINLDLTSKSGWESIFTALSTAGVIFAFTRFQNGLMLAGEVENPQKNIPIAILGAVLIGFVIYFLLQLSFIVAVPPQYLSNGWQHLSFPSASAPLVGLTLLVGLGWVAGILLFDSCFSPFGTTLVYTAATSRILYGMAVNQHLPKVFLKLNRFGVPTVTLWANFIVGVLSFLPFPGWQKMVAFLSSCSILSYGIGPIALLAMRKIKPMKSRPFKLSFATPVCYLAFYVCNLMLHWCGFDVQWKLFLAICVGLIIHIINQRQRLEVKSSALYWFISYLLCMIMISYFGVFGGIGLLKFPLDMLIIFIVSCVFLYLSTFVVMEQDAHEQIMATVFDVEGGSSISVT